VRRFRVIAPAQRPESSWADVEGALLRCSAEGARVKLAPLIAGERDPHVLEIDHLLGRLAAEDLDRVLVAQIIGALCRVEAVQLHAVVRPQGRVYAALGGI